MARRKRVPRTWPHLKIPRGPDRSGWAGDAFTLAARAKASHSGSQYTDLFSSIQTKTVTLGMRHQTVVRYVHKVMEDNEDFKLLLFMGGGQFVFVHDSVREGKRIVRASVVYATLEDARFAHKNNRIIYTSVRSLPIS